MTKERFRALALLTIVACAEMAVAASPIFLRF